MTFALCSQVVVGLGQSGHSSSPRPPSSFRAARHGACGICTVTSCISRSVGSVRRPHTRRKVGHQHRPVQDLLGRSQCSHWNSQPRPHRRRRAVRTPTVIMTPRARGIRVRTYALHTQHPTLPAADASCSLKGVKGESTSTSVTDLELVRKIATSRGKRSTTCVA